MTRGLSPQAAAELRRRMLRTLFGFVAVVLLFNLLFGEMGIIQGIRQRRTADRIAGDVRSLRLENASLMGEIRDLRDDTFRVEAIARQDLGLSRPGEIIFLFPSAAPPPAAPHPGAAAPIPPPGR